MATASKWLRRNPSIPAPTGPTATRTAGWAAVAAARAAASVSAAAASQAHTEEELAITVSTCRARVAGPRASAAAASAAWSGRRGSVHKHGGGVPAAQVIAQPGAGPPGGDGGAVQDEADHLEPARVAAAGQVRALAPELLGQRRHRVIDEAGQRPGAGRQRLAQGRRVGDSENAVRIQYAHTAFCPAW